MIQTLIVDGPLRRGQLIRLRDGSLLNRYWDDRATPRDESWREDVALARSVPARHPSDVYRDVRAAAESGWDFSSRWLGDKHNLKTIRTTRIVPVDLNSLVYGMERAIADGCRAAGDRACAREFDQRVRRRGRAIEMHLWNPAANLYGDFDLDQERVSDERTAAMVYPLFTGIASRERAARTADALIPLVGMGGLATTLRATGQQWDSPNGWAPLQWIAVSALRRYGHRTLASRISQNWRASVDREYLASGRLLEKYDVVKRMPGGGGEYPLQDGFGWTNGVYLALRVADR